MKVVAYARGITPREQLVGAGVTVIDKMSELPHAIEALLAPRTMAQRATPAL